MPAARGPRPTRRPHYQCITMQSFILSDVIVRMFVELPGLSDQQVGVNLLGAGRKGKLLTGMVRIKHHFSGRTPTEEA